LIALLLMGCQRFEAGSYLDDLPPPEAYLRLEDRLSARLIDWGIRWRYPCTSTERDGDIEMLHHLETDQCVRMGPKQRFRGLWNNEFEGSRFCAAPAEECSYISRGEDVWLSFSPEMERTGEVVGGVYSIDFIGRQTLFPGSYGHMGGSDEEVIVDRVIAMRRVGDTPVVTEAELMAYINGRLRARDRSERERRRGGLMGTVRQEK
jgi:hypothetical protein